MSGRTVVILQARMGSQRLPGKVLMDLAGRTVLDRCLDRALAVEGADAVCLATSDRPTDDPIAQAVLKRPEIVLFRGSESDVLARYQGAAAETKADIVMRLTCDCPLIDPSVCAAVLKLLAESGAPYASNVGVRDWPHGLDCEAFSRGALDQAAQEAVNPYDREHVTPYIRRKAGNRAAHLRGPGGEASRQRWTLDYSEDLEFLRALFAAAGTEAALRGWRDVMAIAGSRPDLAAINAARALSEQPAAMQGHS